jgi:hypothetical protein
MRKPLFVAGAWLMARLERGKAALLLELIGDDVSKRFAHAALSEFGFILILKIWNDLSRDFRDKLEAKPFCK